MTRHRVLCALCATVCIIFASSFALAQETPPGYVIHPNQEVRVGGLQLRTAQSRAPADVLVAALEAIAHDPELCCGKNSALGDAALSADPRTLKDVSSKLQGRHLLSDGRPIMVTAEYVAPNTMHPEQIIVSLLNKHAMLMEWKSHLYVLYGANFNETLYDTGVRDYAIRKLYLLDPRFSDDRRHVSFDREANDWTEVQGLVMLTVPPR
jgi:hypothetical protein